MKKGGNSRERCLQVVGSQKGNDKKQLYLKERHTEISYLQNGTHPLQEVRKPFFGENEKTNKQQQQTAFWYMEISNN